MLLKAGNFYHKKPLGDQPDFRIYPCSLGRETGFPPLVRGCHPLLGKMGSLRGSGSKQVPPQCDSSGHGCWLT
jgi:hypothetical protein